MEAIAGLVPCVRTDGAFDTAVILVEGGVAKMTLVHFTCENCKLGMDPSAWLNEIDLI